MSYRRISLTFLAVLATSGVLTASKPPKSAVPATPDDRTILHVLNRIGFGARPGDVKRVGQRGLSRYIDEQLHPERIPDSQIAGRLAGLVTLGKSPRELADEYFIPAMAARREAQEAMTSNGNESRTERTPAQTEAQRRQRQVIDELAAQRVIRAVYGERQLEEVMTGFWFNHFNVFAGKGATAIFLTEYERDVIRPRLFGHFRDLLGATAESPAMLFYLDNWQSADPNAVGPRGATRQSRRGLNENYARELMELHTLGVDGGYTQQDVIEVARCFTGWTIASPRAGGGFRFEPRMHDDGRKVVLGHVIDPGGGRGDGRQVLDILASHPSTARFIATKLVRRFVADAPPPALVSRAAARFRETQGDIREVLKVILTSPEFFSADAYRAKVKSPFEFVASAVRGAGVEVGDPSALVQRLRQLGEPLYQCQPPTGYGDTAQTWVNTGSLINRMNFALALVSGRLRGIQPASDSAAPASEGAARVRAAVVGSVLGNDLSPSTAATLAQASDPRQAVALALASPEFQRR